MSASATPSDGKSQRIQLEMETGGAIAPAEGGQTDARENGDSSASIDGGPRRPPGPVEPKKPTETSFHVAPEWRDMAQLPDLDALEVYHLAPPQSFWERFREGLAIHLTGAVIAGGFGLAIGWTIGTQQPKTDPVVPPHIAQPQEQLIEVMANGIHH